MLIQRREGDVKDRAILVKFVKLFPGKLFVKVDALIHRLARGVFLGLGGGARGGLWCLIPWRLIRWYFLQVSRSDRGRYAGRRG
jgi:hypothetical protein